MAAGETVALRFLGVGDTYEYCICEATEGEAGYEAWESKLF